MSPAWQSFPLVIWISRESRPTIPPYIPDDQGTTVVWNMYYLNGRKPAYKWVSQEVKHFCYIHCTVDQILIAQRDLSSNWCQNVNTKFISGVYKLTLSRQQWRTEGGGFGVFKPPPKFRRPSKIVPYSTPLWKLLKIAEFRTPAHQDVRKKCSKILKLPRFAIVLH